MSTGAKYTYTSPKLHDAEIQTLQNLFAALSWVQVAYPLVRVGRDSEGKTFPIVYTNDGTDISIRVAPDSEVNSFCFFELEGDVTRFPDSVGKYTYPLSVTFWLQLDKVDNTKNYDYTSELVLEIMNILDEQDCFDISYTTEPGEIFDRFSELEEQTYQHFMRNFSAFKISFTKEGTQCN